MDLPKVVSSNQEPLIVIPADSVDVSAVWPVGPQAWGEERAAETSIERTLKLKTHTWRGREREKEPSLTKHLEAQSAGVGGPLNISGGLHTDHLFAHWWDPWGDAHKPKEILN